MQIYIYFKFRIGEVFLQKGTKRAAIFMISSSLLLIVLNLIFTVKYELFYYIFAIVFIIFGIILLVISNKEIKAKKNSNSK